MDQSPLSPTQTTSIGDLNFDILEASMSGALHYRVRVWTDCPGVSIL